MRLFPSLCAALLAVVSAVPAMADPVVSITGEAQQPPPPPPPSTFDRARANYEAILSGSKTYFSLSPIEQEEVRILDRRVRATQPIDTRSSYERCQDAEFAKLGREPTELDQRVIDTRCR